MGTLNLKDIESFFKFLSTQKNPESEIFTYCLLDLQSKDVIPGWGVKFGIIDEIIHTITLKDNQNSGGFTLHTTLNSTKLTGRKTKDIEGVRVLCVDFDRVLPKESLKPLLLANAVQMVVESSPGKYHFYWKIDPSIPLDLWRTYQLGLNHYFGGDTQMAAIGHTIRVPGVQRITKEGQAFMPAIVYMAGECPALTQEQIVGQFPWIKEKAEEAEKVIKKKRREVARTVKQIRLGANEIPKLIKAEDRNSTLFSLIFASVADHQSSIDIMDAAEVLGINYNEALKDHPKGPLGLDEVKKTCESAFERGLVAREKRKEREKRKMERLGRVLGNGVHADMGTNTSTNGYHQNGVEVLAANNRFEYNWSSGDLLDSPYTDYGITERVIQRFGNHLIRTGAIVYAFDRRELVWKSQKGCPTVIHDYVAEVCREVVKEEGFFNSCRGDDGEISIAKFERKKERLLGNAFLMQAVSVVLSSPKLETKSIQIFDNNPYLYYLQNGVIDFRAIDIGVVRAKATDYLLRRAGFLYDAAAVCPAWEKFLLEVFGSNEAPESMVSFIQEIFGYSLTGDVEEQALFLHSGEGSNGKSRVLYALGRLTGDYSTRLQSNALTKSKTSVGKEIERIGAKIEGKRVVIIDDLDTRTQWNDGLVKCLTEKTIVSRRLYEEEKDIPNRAKFHIACNETPAVDGNSFAMFRRVSIIEYNRTFKPDAAKLKEIDAAIDREISGIFNWALRGLKRVLERGSVSRPEEVLTRIEDYKEANQGADVLIPEMFEACLEHEEGVTINDCVLHANKFAHERGYIGTVFKNESLGRELIKQGFLMRRKIKNKIKYRFYLVRPISANNRNPVDTL